MNRTGKRVLGNNRSHNICFEEVKQMKLQIKVGDLCTNGWKKLKYIQFNLSQIF
jgi:hypothetical protein